jgi:hypothetical protein
MLCYKIKNRDGLFSTGGKFPKFKKKGKSWSSLGHLKNHINLVNEYNYYNKDIYKDCVVVTYEVTEVELTGNVPVESLEKKNGSN